MDKKENDWLAFLVAFIVTIFDFWLKTNYWFRLKTPANPNYSASWEYAPVSKSHTTYKANVWQQ